jgi:mannose-1-phosphate guanylyltransferase
MTAKDHLFACVMAGGGGERFWPMSRVRSPKHLLRLLSDQTLLEQTVRRLEGLVPAGNVFVLTNESQLAAVRAALPFLPPAQIVAEPAKRDTAPAAALATAIARVRDPGAVVALLPADHYIRDDRRFGVQLSAAFAWAATRESLLTLAIRPSRPDPGFGYLELGEEVPGAQGGGVFRRVLRFVEKPDIPTARAYLEGGRHAWNAGMFVWRADAFLSEAERSAPDLAAFIRGFPDGDPTAYIVARFPSLPKVSVDYAIMEKARSVATLVAEFDWDDVGLWTALPPHLDTDGAGNATRGKVVAVDSANNIAVSNGRIVALCGVRDLVVVETPDAVLVCHRDAVQDIKKLHPHLPKDVL